MTEKDIKTYEIFTEKFSMIINAANIPAAIKKFIGDTGEDVEEIIAIVDVAYPEFLEDKAALSSTERVECYLPCEEKTGFVLYGYGDEDGESLVRVKKVTLTVVRESDYEPSKEQSQASVASHSSGVGNSIEQELAAIIPTDFQPHQSLQARVWELVNQLAVEKTKYEAAKKEVEKLKQSFI